MVSNLNGFMNSFLSKECYIGRAVSDGEPTIIHHFDSESAQNSFMYPDSRPGLVFSIAMLKK